MHLLKRTLLILLLPFLALFSGCATGPASSVTPVATAPAAFRLQPFAYAQGTMNEQEDLPTTPRTGQVLLCLAGDSTVAYNSGYAAGLRACFDTRLQVINRSRGGRTTVSFIADGRWQDILNIRPDYVMIQFGHNDTALHDLAAYTRNLTRFVDEARAAGITPVLVTPVSRRYWQADGTIKDDLADYVAAMRQVAAEKQVALMELHERAVELYLKVGRKVSESWGLPKADAANPSVTILDKTHFNAEGSRAMGRVAADELKHVVPALAPYIH